MNRRWFIFTIGMIIFVAVVAFDTGYHTGVNYITDDYGSAGSHQHVHECMIDDATLTCTFYWE